MSARFNDRAPGAPIEGVPALWNGQPVTIICMDKSHVQMLLAFNKEKGDTVSVRTVDGVDHLAKPDELKLSLAS